MDNNVDYFNRRLAELRKFPTINKREIVVVENQLLEAKLNSTRISDIEELLADARELKTTATRLIKSTIALFVFGLVNIFIGAANLFELQPAFLGVGIPVFLLSIVAGGFGANWIYNQEPFRKYNKVQRYYTKALIEGVH